MSVSSDCISYSCLYCVSYHYWANTLKVLKVKSGQFMYVVEIHQLFWYSTRAIVFFFVYSMTVHNSKQFIIFAVEHIFYQWLSLFDWKVLRQNKRSITWLFSTYFNIKLRLTKNLFIAIKISDNIFWIDFLCDWRVLCPRFKLHQDPVGWIRQ